jgi:hypothetical protein
MECAWKLADLWSWTCWSKCSEWWKARWVWHFVNEILLHTMYLFLLFLLILSTEPNCRTSPHHWKWGRFQARYFGYGCNGKGSWGNAWCPCSLFSINTMYNYVMLTGLGEWQVKSEEAVKMARELALKEGLLVSEWKHKWCSEYSNYKDINKTFKV